MTNLRCMSEVAREMVPERKEAEKKTKNMEFLTEEKATDGKYIFNL